MSKEVVESGKGAVSNALVPLNSEDIIPVLPSTVKGLIVLDEDTYTAALERIIQRDFFPALPKLKAQVEYLEALENRDYEKLGTLSVRLNTVGKTHVGGNTQTPGMLYGSGGATPKFAAAPGTGFSVMSSKTYATRKDTGDILLTPSGIPVDTTLSLEEFQNTYTSEDNASFSQIMESNNEKRKARHKWLYDNEKKQLLLTGTGKDISKGEVATWKYKAKNSLMYFPDAAPLTEEEKLKKLTEKPTVNYDASRFSGSHSLSQFLPNKDSKETKLDAQPVWKTLDGEALEALRAAQSRAAQLANYTPQARPADVSESPRVGGYGFVAATPSPMPGVDATPLMTWGEIEGTPLLLDPSLTPGPLNKSFKLPEESKREQLGKKLMEQASRSIRSRSQSRPIQKAASPLLTKDRLRAFSPGIQKVGGRSLLGVDSALRASYSKTGKRTLPQSPLVTPKLRGVSESASVTSTPQLLPSPATKVPPMSDGTVPASISTSAEEITTPPPTTTSLTDDLLNI